MGFLTKIYHFLFGYYLVRCEEKEKNKLVNLFFKQRITAYPKEDSCFLISAQYRKKTEEALLKESIKVDFGERMGLPALAYRYRRRVGLLLGALAVCVILCLSSSVVWRVEVSGNERLSSEEIVGDLAEIGFGEGSRIRKTDFAELSTALRLRHGEIAHADIYCVGTVAHVRIREVLDPQKNEKDEAPAHLVASRDAVIESFDVKHGTVVTETGKVVKAGELLVSGIVAGAHGDVILHAEGKVYGRVTDEIIIEIPYKQTVQVALGSEKGDFTLFFFGKAINIRKNAGNLPTTYGTIVEREKWTLWNGYTLPISYLREKAVSLESQSVTLSHQEATSLAYAKLKGKIESTLSDGYLISKSVAATLSDDACILKCTLTYVSCISETKPIGVAQ